VQVINGDFHCENLDAVFLRRFQKILRQNRPEYAAAQNFEPVFWAPLKVKRIYSYAVLSSHKVFITHAYQTPAAGRYLMAGEARPAAERAIFCEEKEAVRAVSPA